jgi:hypothetical protein
MAEGTASADQSPKAAVKAVEDYNDAAEAAEKNNQLDIAPDPDRKPNELGERGTSALPEGHPARKGLDVERAQDTYPGAEKYAKDVIIDGFAARSPREVERTVREYGQGNVSTKLDS